MPLERFQGKVGHWFSVRIRAIKNLVQVIVSNELGFALGYKIVGFKSPRSLAQVMRWPNDGSSQNISAIK